MEVTNSLFTCRGAANTIGGSNIDYFIISRDLMAMVISVLADFSTEWSPHFGIELTLKAEPRAVMNLEVVQPSMPRGLREYDKDAFEENSFQCLAKPARAKSTQRNSGQQKGKR